jgi:16S rRNA (guanine966-N2)-methyltransferase
MRIVAGRHRGKILRAPVGRAVRPTSDRARQALFDILVHHDFGAGAGGAFKLEGARVCDAFCGTGALGLEALSRGAAHAVFMDSDRSALDMARDNARALGEDQRAKFVLADATRPPRSDAPCSLVFVDPPYGSGLAAPALNALAKAGWLADGAVAVVEIAAREDFAAPEGFEVLEERRVGAGRFVIVNCLMI